MPSKAKKQQKPVARQIPLHESIGKDLAEKLHAYSQSPTVCTLEPPKSVFLQHHHQSLWSNSKVDLKGALMTVEPAQILKKRPSEASIAEKKKLPRTNYELDDLNALQTIERLVEQHGRMMHMGVRDHSYHFYLNHARTGVLSYRVLNKVAVISGDPICPVPLYHDILTEFKHYCKTQRWQFAITGGSTDMLALAQQLNWTSMHYAKERSLNVQTNSVLLGSEGKRILSQCKQLLNNNTQLDIYCPSHGRNPTLEFQLTSLYDTWRADRNSSRTLQAFVTVFDLFALPRLMLFIYTTDPTTNLITGFAALRKLQHGYHIDPLIARADAPRGVVDLLLIASLSFLREKQLTSAWPLPLPPHQATRLVLGVEPLDSLGEITNMSRPLEHLTRKSHEIVSGELALGGKKGFHDRFRPDAEMEEDLYILYPGQPSVKQSVAMAHFANVRVKEVLGQRWRRRRQREKGRLAAGAGGGGGGEEEGAGEEGKGLQGKGASRKAEGGAGGKTQ